MKKKKKRTRRLHVPAEYKLLTDKGEIRFPPSRKYLRAVEQRGIERLVRFGHVRRRYECNSYSAGVAFALVVSRKIDITNATLFFISESRTGAAAANRISRVLSITRDPGYDLDEAVFDLSLRPPVSSSRDVQAPRTRGIL